MGSKRQKMETAGMETAGISDLPVEITTEILTRLPIKDAVRTSLLSKHWRYQWMGMNKLLFVNTESDTTKGKNLVNFVNATLLVHKSRIHSFGYTNNFITSDINRWLIVLERHPLKELTLSLKSTNLTKFSMPSRIFFFHSLESFRVEYCRFPSTPPFGAFRSLHTLMLGNVDISQLAVETIVAGSPKLESLTLVSCTPFENLTIRAPKLTYFCMGGKYHSITLVGTTQITQLKLQLNVHLVNQVQTALYLLKNSPLLKSVDIHLSTAGNAQDPEGAALALNVWNSFLVKEDVLLRHLTKVNIKGFLGGPLELAAVEFFFKKASRLKQLSIKWTGRQHTDVIRQVGFFARASPDAVLRF